MMRFLLFLLLLSASGCQPTSGIIHPDSLAQTWRYVGVGSHLADMNWPLDQFDYENAPTLNLVEPKRLSGFSGVNQYGGAVETTLDYTHPQQLAVGGKLSVMTLSQTKRAGTTAQMQIENQLLTGLREATNYYVDVAGSQYQTLSISYGGGSAYLYFVSKQ